MKHPEDTELVPKHILELLPFEGAAPHGKPTAEGEPMSDEKPIGMGITKMVFVSGCTECPFLDLTDDSYPACGAPEQGEGILFEGHDDDPPEVSPDWCTLRNHAITVILKVGDL